MYEENVKQAHIFMAKRKSTARQSSKRLKVFCIA